MNLFLFAGEASGDLLGSKLIHALKQKLPEATFWGVGGPLMKREGLSLFEPMESYRMMGILEVVKGLHKLPRQFRTLTKEILKRNPAAVILIDYPGFNLRLAKKLRQAGYLGKIIQYVSPTVWVWRKGRIKTLEKYFDLLLCIMPFEPPLYKNLKALYVGHPAAENIPKKLPSPPLLALFPGSREAELKRNLPLEISLAKKFLAHFPHYKVAISCQDPAYYPLLAKVVENLPIEIDQTDTLIQRAHLAIAKSGTVNLELALGQVPSVVVYQVDGINRFIARYLMRLKLTYASIVNILTNQELFPEFVIRPFTEEEIVNALISLESGEKRESTLEGCKKLREFLSDKHASNEAANAIHECLLL